MSESNDLDDKKNAARTRARAHRAGGWKASEEQTNLFPDVSGNLLNGLGERERRRASLVYWDDPDALAHGPLQKYFYDQYFSVPEIVEVYNDRGPETLPDVNPVREQRTAAEWTESVKSHVQELGCEMVGIARMDPQWVYQDREVSEPWIVMLGLVMDQPKLATAPSTPEDPTSAVEVAVNLARITRVSNSLTGWIREHGWEAEPRPGQRPTGALALIPAAIACGFGELGKHGSLIHPEYGSSFRLAAVTTTLPLVADEPRQFGADEFCSACGVCTSVCPPDAIFKEKQYVRGEKKWYVNFEKCVPYFNDHYGCGICIAECPWSLPGVAGGLVEK
ncbi:MAG: 4Fe-4S dicluster domain-containing protein, partial [Bauldia litoralis]